jgi:hypothetical protein
MARMIYDNVKCRVHIISFEIKRIWKFIQSSDLTILSIRSLEWQFGLRAIDKAISSPPVTFAIEGSI